MKLSVVMNTFNRRHALEKTLPSLLAQDQRPEDFEVVFVVDGSTDGTAELLNSWKTPFAIKVIVQPNRGMEVARNVGVAAARGEIVLFLDDDIICSPGVIRQHTEAHGDDVAVVAHGPIYVAPESPKSLIRYGTEQWYKSYYGRLNPAVGLQIPKEIYLLANSSLSRKLLVESGGFDEQTPELGDIELGLRLAKMGIRFRFLPAAIAYELFVKASGEFIGNQVSKWGKAQIYLCRKHPEYRPYSRLAVSAKSPGWRRLAREIVARFPVSAATLLKPALRLTERLSGFASVREAGIRLLGIATQVTVLRGAVREAGSWQAYESEFGARLPVLLYHHIGSPLPTTNPQLTVSPERFERHVRWLAGRGYVGIRAADWLRWCREGKGLPRKPVLITFDDGYGDLVEHAFPVLRRYGFSALVFLVTAEVGGTNSWAPRPGKDQLMTAEQISYWAAQGIEFGGHTRTHPDLTKLSAADLVGEIGGSGQDVARLTGSPATSFAYPFGFYNEAVRQCTSDCFDLAFTCEHTINTLRTDRTLLGRTMVQPNDSLLDLALRVRQGWSPIQGIRARVRLRTRIRQALGRVL